MTEQNYNPPSYPQNYNPPIYPQNNIPNQSYNIPNQSYNTWNPNNNTAPIGPHQPPIQTIPNYSTSPPQFNTTYPYSPYYTPAPISNIVYIDPISKNTSNLTYKNLRRCDINRMSNCQLHNIIENSNDIETIQMAQDELECRKVNCELCTIF